MGGKNKPEKREVEKGGKKKEKGVIFTAGKKAAIGGGQLLGKDKDKQHYKRGSGPFLHGNAKPRTFRKPVVGNLGGSDQHGKFW